MLNVLTTQCSYPKELVAGWTCRDLASIKLTNNAFRRGDLIDHETELEVVNHVEESNVGFANAYAATQSKFEGLPWLPPRQNHPLRPATGLLAK
jgi:hypothetical protein